MNRSLRLIGAAAALGAIACGRGLTPAVPAPAPAPTPAVDTRPAVPPPAAPDSAPRRLPVGAPPVATPPEAPRRVVSEALPPIAREFRGVWVASVANIDWPSRRTLSTVEQQRELLELLDRVVALRLNAVIFQVRPAADALYDSKIEPWSEYLTGTQGKAPSPYWDPLEFAVREAHARGLELHAWFNPYRARNTDARSPLAATHIARTNPALVKQYAGFLWMDPAEKAVRERTLRVVLDVVRRYDIDGVHIDDYFYPYPANDRRGAIPFPDDVSWRRYQRAGGKLSRADWRRSNVDSLVQALDTRIHQVKPWVRFGISPFGIWRPGHPAIVRGLDAYEVLYADARKWLREGWLDYFTPQLYWPTTAPAQPYAGLLAWWSSENVRGRHLWPGNFTSRAAGAGASAFSVAELIEQIRVTRLQPGATGNVHFSMKAFLVNQGRMNDALVAGPYATPALPPASPWMQVAAPPLPTPRLVEGDDRLSVALSAEGRVVPWQWVIRARTDTGWVTTLLPGRALRWPLPANVTTTAVTVTALNRVGTESAPVPVPLTTSPSSSSPARPGRGRIDAP